jgi:hypothetical protein
VHHSFVSMRRVLGLAGFAVLAACGSEKPIAKEQPYVGGALVTDASSAQRFGFTPKGAGGATGGAATDAAPELFDFVVPAGWSNLAPTSMRAVNLAVEREPAAQCTLTLLSGDGGGLAANIDRWRGQMSLAPSTAAELAALPTGELLGRPAVRVDFAGDYSGMGAAKNSGYRMVGLLAVASEGSAFLKFVGPAPVVEAELAAFDAVAASLRPRDAAAANVDVAAEAPSAAAPSVANGGATAAGSNAKLRWQAPTSWTQGPTRMMREVTYTTPDGMDCYISVLAGEGGGIRANFDRWRGQMGAAPLSSEELAALERVPSLGATALLIEIAGSFEGMGGEKIDDALMLGAVIAQDDATVFVKLVAPTAVAQRERENFRAFVTSLELAQ